MTAKDQARPEDPGGATMPCNLIVSPRLLYFAVQFTAASVQIPKEGSGDGNFPSGSTNGLWVMVRRRFEPGFLK